MPVITVAESNPYTFSESLLCMNAATDTGNPQLQNFLPIKETRSSSVRTGDPPGLPVPPMLLRSMQVKNLVPFYFVRDLVSLQGLFLAASRSEGARVFQVSLIADGFVILRHIGSMSCADVQVFCFLFKVGVGCKNASQ